MKNEIYEIAGESAIMERKLQRFLLAEDMEDKDSHMRAISGCIHGIFTGLEKVIKDLIHYREDDQRTGRSSTRGLALDS